MHAYRLAVASIAMKQAREQAQKNEPCAAERPVKEMTPRQEERDWDRQYRHWVRLAGVR